MNSGCILASDLMCCAFALPSFSKDWLFVPTNWKKGGNERGASHRPRKRPRTYSLESREKIGRRRFAGRLYVTFVGEGYELAVVETATGDVLHIAETPPLENGRKTDLWQSEIAKFFFGHHCRGSNLRSVTGFYGIQIKEGLSLGGRYATMPEPDRS